MKEPSQLDVICIGNLNFDMLFFTERLPKKHEKLSCEEVYTGFGGMAGNTAFWLRKLDFKVGLVGCLGDDILGKMHLQHLKKIGIDTSNIKMDKEHSGIAVVFSKRQEKRMIKYPGANAHIFVDLKYLSKAKHVHLSSNKIEIVEEVMMFCNEREIPVSYDPAERQYVDLMDKVDYLILNEDELRKAVGQNDLQIAIKDLNPRNLIVTKNEGGCLIKSRGTLLDIPSFKIKPIDTTGAGDAFNAGFICGLLKNKDIEESCYYGVAAASIKVKHVGARSGDINLENLERMVSEKKNGA